MDLDKGFQRIWVDSDALDNFTVSGDGSRILTCQVSQNSSSDIGRNHQCTMKLSSTVDGNTIVTWKFFDDISSFWGSRMRIALDSEGKTAFGCYCTTLANSDAKSAKYRTWKFLENNGKWELNEEQCLTGFNKTPYTGLFGLTVAPNGRHFVTIESSGDMASPSDDYVLKLHQAHKSPLHTICSINFTKKERDLIPKSLRLLNECTVIFSVRGIGHFMIVLSDINNELSPQEGGPQSVPVERVISDWTSHYRPFRHLHLEPFPFSNVTYLNEDSHYYSKLISINDGSLHVWDKNTHNLSFHRPLVPPITESEIIDVSQSQFEDLLAIVTSERLFLLDKYSFQKYREYDLPCKSRTVDSKFIERRYLQIIIQQRDLQCLRLPFTHFDKVSSQTAKDLSSLISANGEHIGAGGFGDVFRSSLLCHSIYDSSVVAVKRMRINPSEANYATSLTRVRLYTFSLLIADIFHAGSLKRAGGMEKSCQRELGAFCRNCRGCPYGVNSLRMDAKRCVLKRCDSRNIHSSGKVRLKNFSAGIRVATNCH